MKLVRTCIAMATMSPMFALAVSPGQYAVGGVQQICLQAAGTWYGTTFPAWGGHWQNLVVGGATNTYVYGNFSSDGNDSMAFKKGKKGPWTEWHDGAVAQVVDPTTLKFVKTSCDPPAEAAQGGKTNPQD